MMWLPWVGRKIRCDAISVQEILEYRLRRKRRTLRTEKEFWSQGLRRNRGSGMKRQGWIGIPRVVLTAAVCLYHYSPRPYVNLRGARRRCGKRFEKSRSRGRGRG
jgi:hypothetical protein